MRILFAGSPQFAVPSLELIHRHFDVCGVLTAPDKESGRGRKIIPCMVKQKALSLHLKVFDPVKLDNQEIDEIKKLKPDILVVAAYGKIFKENFISLFPMGGINIHPSLLPRFRGPSPIPAVLLAGDAETGVTIQRLALQMDRGNILLQVRTPVPPDATTLGLTGILSELSAVSVQKVLTFFSNNTIAETIQDENAATYCKLIKKEQGKIDWNESAVINERKVRAYFPWPRAYTTFRELLLVITRASVIDTIPEKPDAKPGMVTGVDENHGILVRTGDGILCISRLKLQTKREMDFKDFLNGHKDIINSRLGERYD
ncbi:MAG: methionyl-tRNA formyltransferase [Spirochaetales bacterium]|nr:methionyl-tRNA formyltransferase [Spirochaetales bacterium]